ncbi:MAG: type II secretion system protein [Epsilonproteobacteria bacterium]|nr:type II secretion system protein [Campylobacterota bacterium]
MKKAFSLLELVFVIVVIGILASIAIPKFLATRHDAEVSKIIQSTQNAVKEVTNYVNAKNINVTDEPILNMSNTLTQLVKQGKAKSTFSGHGVDIFGYPNRACVSVREWNITTLMVYTHPEATGIICSGVKKVIKDTNYTISGVNFSF